MAHDPTQRTRLRHALHLWRAWIFLAILVITLVWGQALYADGSWRPRLLEHTAPRTQNVYVLTDGAGQAVLDAAHHEPMKASLVVSAARDGTVYSHLYLLTDARHVLVLSTVRSDGFGTQPFVIGRRRYYGYYLTGFPRHVARGELRSRAALTFTLPPDTIIRNGNGFAARMPTLDARDNGQTTKVVAALRRLPRASGAVDPVPPGTAAHAFTNPKSLKTFVRLGGYAGQLFSSQVITEPADATTAGRDIVWAGNYSLAPTIVVGSDVAASRRSVEIFEAAVLFAVAAAAGIALLQELPLEHVDWAHEWSRRWSRRSAERRRLRRPEPAG